MSDFRTYGGSEGLGFYWIKGESQWGTMRLVAINDVGEVIRTGAHADHDPAAMTVEEAVIHHLAAGIAMADADLERRRGEAPEEPQGPEEPPQYPDPATERFFSDDD